MKKKALTLFLCVMFGLLCLLPAKAQDDTDDTLTGNTVLAADTEYEETKSVSGTATLDLQGHTLTFTGTGSVFQVKSGGTLTITDSSVEKTGVITGGNVLESATPMISEGSFGGGAFVNDLSSGGGVYVAAGGKLILTGGTIRGNHALYGGGVYLESGASLEVSGSASVTGNDTGEESDEESGEVSGRPSNVWLPLDENQTQSVITLADALDSGAVIGVSAAGALKDGPPVVITSGLSGKGGLSNFTSDDAAHSIRLNDDGEAELTYLPVSYTVTAADTNPTAGTKYHSGENITIAVTVSGADFEGGEFTLNYDSATLEVKNFPSNNKFANSEQTVGSVKFEALNKAKITDGNALATITFTVKTKVTTDTTCNFTFDGTPEICYDTGENSVAAVTVTPGSVIVEPVTYTVTLTPSPSGFTLTGDNGVASVDNGKAVDGQPYAATIGNYDTNNYTYEISLTMNGETATAPTPDNSGVLTISGDDITGDFTLTVTRTLENFTLTTTADYVTGWTLVTVAKASGREDNPVYNYDNKPMYYVNAYSAYAYLVSGAVTETDATAKVTLGTSAVKTIDAGYDVNSTGKTDYSDALLTYRCYEVVQTPSEAMETYLRADVDASGKVDTTDVSEIDSHRTQESGS